MIKNKLAQGSIKQYIISVLAVVFMSAICFLISDFIGYRAVALLLLATVSMLAIYFTLFPVLVAAALSALIWDYFFIPPHFTLHVENAEDFLMLTMYFIVAFINGALTSKIRGYEKLESQRTERNITLQLYKTIFDSISHEMRTPIAAIIAASDNLLSKTGKISDENKLRLIEEISIASFRLNRLVDNLLNMQRLESGLLKPKLDWCDLHELINKVINRLHKELSNHLLEINMNENLPLVRLDAGLIEQAIYNILHNAAIYTPADTNISILAQYKEGNMIIAISDQGKGFSPEELEKVFTKFYRSAPSPTGGIGLGLSIVKGFIESHNGVIKVENNQPHGARFTIVLPAEIPVFKKEFDLQNVKTIHQDK